MGKDKKNCLYYYPFFKGQQLCTFKNQPHIGDKCEGVNCGNYEEYYKRGFIGGGTNSSHDSFRRMGSDRHHDSNE